MLDILKQTEHFEKLKPYKNGRKKYLVDFMKSFTAFKVF